MPKECDWPKPMLPKQSTPPPIYNPHPCSANLSRPLHISGPGLILEPIRLSAGTTFVVCSASSISTGTTVGIALSGVRRAAAVATRTACVFPLRASDSVSALVTCAAVLIAVSDWFAASTLEQRDSFGIRIGHRGSEPEGESRESGKGEEEVDGELHVCLKFGYSRCGW